MSEVKSVDVRSLVDSYEFPCTLPGSGQELLISPITTGQMKKILIYEDETDPYVIEQALDKLISDCVVGDDFDIDGLYLQDRFFLLIEIRKISKGSNYSFNFKCPKCRIDNVKNFSLDDLPVKKMNVVNNKIKVSDNYSLEVGFPTRADQKLSLDSVNEQKLTGKERDIELVTSVFACCIKKIHTKDTVVDEISLEDRVYILDNLISDKFDVFKGWFEDNDFGVDFELTVSCEHCDFEDKQKIPLSDFFV